jgi:formylglycine-generating enzyme required for sulfatase activity
MRVSLLLFLVGISISSFGQFKAYSNDDFAKKLEQSMCKVNDSLFACAFECSLNDYRTFINDLKSRGVDVQPYLPDTMAVRAGYNATWRDSFSSDYFPYRLKHPAYAHYPITNISPNAAKAYCAWLNELYATYGKAKFANVEFVLPTENQWKEAAYGIRTKKQRRAFEAAQVLTYHENDYPWFSDRIYVENNNKSKWVDLNILARGFGSYLMNDTDFRKANFHDSFHSHDETKPVKSYSPNGIGMYCVIGNVAEMTAESNLLKGGSFMIHYFGCTVSSKDYYYQEPAWDIGFRVFMKVKRTRTL